MASICCYHRRRRRRRRRRRSCDRSAGGERERERMKPQLIELSPKSPLSCSPACPREGPAGFISRIPRSSPGLLLLPYLYSFSAMSSLSSSLRSGAVQFKKKF
jgi:hypothetical protein